MGIMEGQRHKRNVKRKGDKCTCKIRIESMHMETEARRYLELHDQCPENKKLDLTESNGTEVIAQKCFGSMVQMKI